MRTWKRAVMDQACGSCGIRSGVLIKRGTPFLEIEIDGTRRARCVACAGSMFGEQPPVDLPELPAAMPTTETREPNFVAVPTLANDLAMDFRKRAAGDE